jgi:hypothetical protein
LKWVRRVFTSNTFDCGDGLVRAGSGERQTGVRRPSVEEDGTGAAFAAAADELRSGELEPFAQRDKKRLMARDADIVRRSVDDETHRTILARTTSNRRITRGTHALRHHRSLHWHQGSRLRRRVPGRLHL